MKFPNFTHDLEYFANNLPETTIIWPIRNPYAVVSSMLRWKQKQGNWIKVYAQRELWKHSFLFPEILDLDIVNLDEVSLGAYVWKYKERTLHLYKQSNLNVFSFKYEDLLDNSRLIMSKIIKLIGLEWNENILNHENYYQSNQVYAGGTRGDKAVDRSRKQPKLYLSEDEIDLITHICSQEMKPYQYEKLVE